MSRFFIKRNVRLMVKVYFFFAFIGAVAPFSPSVLNSYKKEQFSSEQLSAKTFIGEQSAAEMDRALVVASPDKALNIRFELIRSAEKSLDITYYSIERSECIDAFFR